MDKNNFRVFMKKHLQKFEETGNPYILYSSK